MTLVELPVDAGDARAVFMRCKRQPDEASKKTFLRLSLVSGPRLWRCDIHEKQKPVVLDCSASEYLAALEAAFTVGSDGAKQSQFSYKWASDKAVLTLMEHAGKGLAMKYSSLTFERVDQEDECWQELLHEMVVQGQHSYNETARQRKRIAELEGMLTKKDSLLETALRAKQRLEDELFAKFSAVLNAKKEEIERLQRSLAIAQAKTNSVTAYQPKAANGAKKRAALTGRKKAVGAKLAKDTKKRRKKSSEEDDEEEAEESDSEEEEEEEGDSSGSEEEGEGEEGRSKKKSAPRSRAKREAIEAYIQLASQLQTPSQARAVADVLDDLDAIMKTEVEHDEEQTLSQGNQTRKRSAPPSAVSSRAPEKKSKVATLKAEIPQAEPKPKPASPPKRPMDSEEEDILDMLS